MKITGSIFAKVTLGLAVTAAVAACNNNKPAATTPAVSTTVAAPNKGTTVYINSDSLLAKYDYAKDMQDRLNAKSRTAQGSVQSKENALRREIADYQKVAATLAADKRQETEQRLAREQQEFGQYQQSESAELQKYQAEETERLFNKLADFAKSHAKEKGYKLILTYSKTAPGVLFVDPSLDITSDAVKLLNDAYAKDKK
ncbi:OmpH family outer membrane protein [Mucilaginibacter antarcticus]|uniref:OmpH family outer membrane protein n=1 Tax=Mucilaginibacter antarcticus TaxID=1855725 RepID=A0ABW5XPJ1_9SPHI